MSKIKEEYKKEEEADNLIIQNNMREWIAVKVYNDQEDSIQFHADKEMLDAKRIVSRAKSTLGITTISVKEGDVEVACSVLGVGMPDVDSENA